MTKQMNGQMTLGGREVQEVTLDVPGIGERDVDLDAYEWEPVTDDEVEVAMTMVVVAVGWKEDHDRLGVGTGPLTYRVKLKAMTKGFQVTAIIRHSDKQTIWNADHGAVS